jgi:hypothetical protein
MPASKISPISSAAERVKVRFLLAQVAGRVAFLASDTASARNAIRSVDSGCTAQ